MDNDDLPVGRVHSRREILALFGVSGSALLATRFVTQAAAGNNRITPARAVTEIAPTSMCIATPAETEGPYFVDEMLNRSDVRSDPSDGTTKEGVPLTLAFNLSAINNGCTPLAGATVDIWQCDALGVYSDATDSGAGFKTVGKKFLRGTQTADANGAVQFTTIYPGWYQGRAVHIHFKVRTTTPANTSYEFTSQLYFDEILTDQIHAQVPYASNGPRDTLNSKDIFYTSSGGDQLLLAPLPAPDTGGYAATFAVGLDLSKPSVAPPFGMFPGGGPPPGGGMFPGGRPPGSEPPPGSRPIGTPTG